MKKEIPVFELKNVKRTFPTSVENEHGWNAYILIIYGIGAYSFKTKFYGNERI